MVRRIICVGLGGQGVLTVGKLLMEAAVDKNLQCTWTCKYGNEMRGGYSECNVIISDEKIASPYADHPDIVFLMKNDGPVVEKTFASLRFRQRISQRSREEAEMPTWFFWVSWLPNPACSLMTSSKRPCASTLNPMERASSTKAIRKCWLPERMLNGMLH